MEPQEAIEIIKIALAEVEWNYPMDYYIAFCEAIKALEKQISMDFQKMKNGMFSVCNSCNYPIHRMENYCPNCGQKIRWN